MNGLICCRCHGPVQLDGGGLACVGCGAAYPNDDGVYVMMPDDLDDHALAEELYWRNLAPTQERDWQLAKAHLVRGLQTLLLEPGPVRGSVLEIGAGVCWASALLKRTYRGAYVTASDISTSALHLADAVFERVGARPDRLIACDMSRLPLADASVDLVFGVAVLHHAEDPAVVLREIRRVLKPGGRYFGFDEFATNRLFRRYWRIPSLSPFARRSDHLGVTEEVYTFDEWRRALSLAGFGAAAARFNRDWRLKRTEGFRRLYFQLTAPLPDSVFQLLPGGSVIIDAYTET
jgi:SAM-dependent methyltransferase